MATLTLQQVSKSYPEHITIQNVSIDIADGEFIVVVGPSGCGKTTLLRMIAGLEDVTAGNIKIDNKVVNKVEAKDRNIAMVFQNYALYPHMTIYQNMAYGLKIRGFRKEETDKRVKNIAEILSLTKVLDRKPRQLSGGQRQRVAMGRAMVREPAIFLFDEPLSNLDATLRVQMRLEIKKLQKQFKTTSVYVTHDQVEAMTLADRLIVMNHGVVEQIGSPLEIYHQPATQFVAGFMGVPAMNFITVKVLEEEKIELPGGFCLEHTSHKLELKKNQTVILGIRPECFMQTPHQDDQPFKIRIDVIEALGSDTLIYGQLLESKQLLTVRLAGSTKVNVGDVFSFYVNPHDFHFFDEETGAVISV